MFLVSTPSQVFLNANNYSDVPLSVYTPTSYTKTVEFIQLEYQTQRVAIPVTPYSVFHLVFQFRSSLAFSHRIPATLLHFTPTLIRYNFFRWFLKGPELAPPDTCMICSYRSPLRSTIHLRSWDVYSES